MRVGVAFLRTRHFVVTHARVLCVLLLVVAVASAFGAVASYDGLPTETVEETKHSTTVGMSVGTHSVVTGNTTLYEKGEELNDTPVYLTSASPQLALTLRSSLPQGSQVEQNLSVVHRVSHSDGGEVFWEEKHLVVKSREKVDGVSTTGEAVTSASVNVRRVLERRTEIGNEIGGAGKVETFVVAEATYNTGRYEGELADEARLVVDRRSYSLRGDTSQTEKHTTSAEVESVDDDKVVPLPASVGGLGSGVPKKTATVAGLGVVSLLFSLLVFLYARFAPDRDELRRRLNEQRYSEWISVGRLPPVTEKSGSEVRLGSLGDLVDVGIDASKRTIHDPEAERYGVIDDGTVYYYEEAERHRNRGVEEENQDNGRIGGETEFFFARREEYR